MGNQLYSQFDFADQVICRLAQKLGYHTIILQREPGEKRVVTEVLDVRPRDVSYRSFCDVSDDKFQLWAYDSNYPTIWFTDYRFHKIEIY